MGFSDVDFAGLGFPAACLPAAYLMNDRDLAGVDSTDAAFAGANFAGG